MKQNQYLVPAAIVALALVILIVAFKPSKESTSDGMSKETTTLATPSARGGVTAPEMLPLLAKVTELTEKTVQSQNEAQLAKNQAAQLASEVRAANQALEIAQQEVARLAKIIKDANDRSIKVGMHIDEAVRRRGSPTMIVERWKDGDVIGVDSASGKYILWDSKNEIRNPDFWDSLTKITKPPFDYGTNSHSELDRITLSKLDDLKSARRQDPNMNKNDDQVWLIGKLWIFIDKNKIITSTGPDR